MQAAQDRYNRGKVFTPVLPTQASKDYQSVQSAAASSQSATGQSTSATPAAAGQGAPTATAMIGLARVASRDGVSDDDANWTVRQRGGQDAGRRADG